MDENDRQSLGPTRLERPTQFEHGRDARGVIHGYWDSINSDQGRISVCSSINNVVRVVPVRAEFATCLLCFETWLEFV